MKNKGKRVEHVLPDIRQTPFQVAVIQLTGFMSLPLLASSVVIRQATNFVDAIATLVIANLLLWIFRLGIISIGYSSRKSTLDVASDFVGGIGRYFVAIQLLLSTLAWYIAQTTLASNAIFDLLPFDLGSNVNHRIQISVLLGVLSTLLCQEGIIVLRWLAVVCFPIILFVFFGVMATTAIEWPVIDSYKVTLGWLPLALGTSLGITADLPTFFRHADSWKTCLSALTIIQIVSLLIAIAGLFLGPAISPWLEGSETGAFTAGSALQRSFLIMLIFFSVICANVSNVYSASVGWELIAPGLASRKEYLILGLGLTTLFILVSNIFSMNMLLETTDSSLVNLCFVLLMGYLIQRYLKRRPSYFEQVVYFTAFFLATLINILQILGVMLPHYSILVTGPLIMILVIVVGFWWAKSRKDRQSSRRGI